MVIFWEADICSDYRFITLYHYVVVILVCSLRGGGVCFFYLFVDVEA